MGWIIAMLVRAGLSQGRAAALAPWVAGMALIALVAALWAVSAPVRGLIDHFNDRKAVEEATNAANAEFRERQLEVEREAGHAKAGRDSANDRHQQELEDLIDDARANGTTAADDAWNNGLWTDPED